MTTDTHPPKKTPPRPRGRPRLAPGAGRTARLELRLTAARRDRIIALAEAEGLSFSAWLEKRLDG